MSSAKQRVCDCSASSADLSTYQHDLYADPCHLSIIYQCDLSTYQCALSTYQCDLSTYQCGLSTYQCGLAEVE